MAVATGTALLITGALAAGATAYGAKKGGDTSRRASDQAVSLAREQEAQRKKEWEIQQAAEKERLAIEQANLKQQWEREEAQLAPYRAARAGLLQKYGYGGGVDMGPRPMPAGYGGPSGMANAAPVPQGRMAPNPMTLGPGNAMASQVIDRGPQMAGQVIDRPAVRTTDLGNWDDWRNYGVGV